MQASAEPIVVFGGGGHAKSVLGALSADPRWHVVGLIDDQPHPAGETHLGHPFVGGRESIPSLLAQGRRKVIVAIGDNAARLRVAEALRLAGMELATVTHPSAILSPGCSLGEGAFIHALAIIGPECAVGRNAIVMPYVSVGHESRVGDGAQLSPGAHIGGRVEIGARCFLGPGAVIHPGVRIGEAASIGANSVVHKDVPAGAILAGNPARVIGANPA